MTRLRKMMLEELQRRNYTQSTTRYYIRTVEDFALATSTAHRIAWGRSIFANTKRCYFTNGTCHREASPSAWPA